MQIQDSNLIGTLYKQKTTFQPEIKPKLKKIPYNVNSHNLNSNINHEIL